MRLVQTAVLATIITVTSSVNVVAQDAFISGNKLLEHCRDGSFSQGYCMGYVVGIASAWGSPGSRSFCFAGKGVTKEQLVDVVTPWLEKLPQHRLSNASDLVDEALAEAFPLCKEY